MWGSHGFWLSGKRKVAVYYSILSLLVVSAVCGAIWFKGKSETKEYSIVGTLSDLVNVEALQANGSLCETQFSRENERLTIDITSAASEIHIHVPSAVLDSKPDFLFLELGVYGTSDSFTYVIRVEKAGFDGEGFSHISSRNFLFKSNLDERLFTLNLRIHDLKNIERNGNPLNDTISIYRADFDASPVYVNEINRVVIENLRFVKEETGREPALPILLGFPFLILVLYVLVVLYVLPIIFLKLKKPSTIHVMIIAGFLIRMLIAPFTSYAFDVGIWKYAGRKFYEDGEIALFTNWSLPPFWFFTIIAFYLPYMLLRQLGMQDTRIYYQPVSVLEVTFIKLPLILADIFSAFLIYKICRERNLDEKISRIAAAGYLFNPFGIYISSVWPMLDSLAVSFGLLGLYMAIKKRFYLSSLIWGFAVKWYTLGFIPILSIFAYFQNEEKSLRLRLSKSALIILLGFGFFAAQMLIPYIISGDIAYLSQTTTFRLKTGGEASFVDFEGVTFWALFRYIGVVPSLDNFFLLTFLPLYSISLGLLFLRFRKRASEGEHKTFSLFNNTLIAILLAFYLTYPQMAPQNILWVLPHLILAYYLSKDIGVLPIVIIVLSVLSILGDISYYTIGFSVSSISVAATPSNYLSYAISTSFIPIALWFFLKLLSPTLNTKVSTLCKSLLSRFHLTDLLILYASVFIIAVSQAVAIYTFHLRSILLLPLLVSTILLQCIVLFSMGFGMLDQLHKVEKCTQ